MSDEREEEAEETDHPATGPRSDGGMELSEAEPRTPELWRQAASADPDDGVAYELDVYAGFLDSLVARGYEFVGFDGEIEDGQIAIRHDVDISLERAAEMARVESALGVTSTYCLLVTNPLYDLLAPDSRQHLRTILGAGHDVGLHFDPHYYWESEPGPEELEERVLEDRAALQHALEFVMADAPTSSDADGGPQSGASRASSGPSTDGDTGVAAVSIHQPPEWSLGVDFEAFESTYAPPYFESVEYVSDSAGKWRSQRPFTEGVPDAMQLLVHPGLWQPEDRPMTEILAEHRELCRERVAQYVDPFGG